MLTCSQIGNRIETNHNSVTQCVKRLDLWSIVYQYTALKMKTQNSVIDAILAASGTTSTVDGCDVANRIRKKAAASATDNGSKSSATGPSKAKWKQFTRRAFHGNRSAKSTVETDTAGHDLSVKSELLEHMDLNDLSLLQILALKSLELTAPASDMILKNHTSQWVQLSGHEGSLAPAAPGTIWKKRTSDDTEVSAYRALAGDSMMDFVPKFYDDIEYRGENFIEMQDLLYGFVNPSIMDVKIGTRTYLESEVSNSKARRDLYEKMVKIDPNEPTEEEHEAQAITKLRYMTFRENSSTTCDFGFRIEGIKASKMEPDRRVQNFETSDDIKDCLREFLLNRNDLRSQLITKLSELRSKLEVSYFFKTHEVIGSSLLIVHEGNKLGLWMIDFAKTLPLPDGLAIDHTSPWTLGNHEDGYLFGLDNISRLLSESFNE